jgi:mannose-6-phosphate isomerase-like protein (cupin superfamily)
MKAKTLLFTAVVLHVQGAFAEDADFRVATVVSADILEAVAAAAPPAAVSDVPVIHVESAEGRLGVGVVHRPVIEPGGPLQGIQHHKQSEVYRVMAGAGVLVTARRMSAIEHLDDNGHIVQNLTGPSSIGVIDEAEDSQAIAEGDVVIIPAGVAHGFSEISAPITYMVIRVDPERLVALKGLSAE